MNLDLIKDLDNPIWKNIEWLDLDRDSRNKVKGVIPEQFEHYFKIFTSIGLQNGKNENPVKSTYEEISKLAGLSFESNFAPYKVLDNFRGPKVDYVILKEEDLELIWKLVEIFGPETTCFFHGFGDDLLPEDYMNSWVAKGKVKDLPDLFKAMNEDGYLSFNFFPEYIFAENKEWCLGNIYHQSGIYLLGCNKEIADKIKNQDTIEFQELKAEDIYI